MNGILDDFLVGLVLTISAGYAVFSLGPRSLRSRTFAALSRGVCGVRGRTLILNVPGSPSGAVESLQAVVELVPHALSLLDGKTEHS